MDGSFQSLLAFLSTSCFQPCLVIAHFAFDTPKNNLLEIKSRKNRNLLTDFGLNAKLGKILEDTNLFCMKRLMS